MRTIFGLATAVSLLSSGAAFGQSMTKFDSEVRDTLLRNPQIILEVFELLESQEREAEAKQDIEKITKNEKALFGDLDPTTPVIVEFLDYRCGYCRRNHAEVMEFLERNPNVVLIEKQFPILGEESVVLSKTAMAIRMVYGEDAYRAFHDTAMIGDIVVEKYLIEKGYDLDKIEEARSSDIVHNDIANVRGLARRMGINGTPAFISRSKIIPRYADVRVLTDAVFGVQQ